MNALLSHLLPNLKISGQAQLYISPRGLLHFLTQMIITLSNSSWLLKPRTHYCGIFPNNLHLVLPFFYSSKAGSSFSDFSSSSLGKVRKKHAQTSGLLANSWHLPVSDIGNSMQWFASCAWHFGKHSRNICQRFWLSQLGVAAGI